MAVILISVIVSIAVYIIFTWLKEKAKRPLPPGPSLVESLKITWRLLQHNDLFLISEDLTNRYGEILTIKILNQNMILLNSSRVLRKVLSSNQYRELTNDRPPSFFRQYVLYGGKDIFFQDNNDKLAKLRRIVHGAIKLYGEGVKTFEERVTFEIRNLQKQIESSVGQSSFDLDHALTMSIVRVLHILLTDELPDSPEEVARVVEDHDYHINIMFRFSINLIMTVFPWIQHVPGPFRRMFKGMISSRDNIQGIFLNPAVTERMKSKNKGILARVLLEAESDKDIDDHCIKGVLTDLVAAGYLTTKSSLAGFFLLMLYYPEVQERIHEEIDEIIGKDRTPSLEDRPLMHYTNAALLESLRFINHTPIGVPHQTREEIEVDGMRIPAHTTLITNYWMITHSEKAWDNPNLFKPERFLDEEGRLLSVEHPTRTQLLPFGIGRRVCLGETFAKSRIFLYVTSLLQKFKFLPGNNKLANPDPRSWQKISTMQLDFLKCVVEVR